MFRTEPLSHKMEPLLVAFSKTLKGMPASEEPELPTYLAWESPKTRPDAIEDITDALFEMESATYKFGVTYRPGKHGVKEQTTWQAGAWRPRGDVNRSFEAVGGEHGEVATVWQLLNLWNSEMTLIGGRV